MSLFIVKYVRTTTYRVEADDGEKAKDAVHWTRSSGRLMPGVEPGVEQASMEVRDVEAEKSAELLQRLRSNQAALEAAIRDVPGWEDFNGTPESAVGAAVSILRDLRAGPQDGGS